MHAGTSVTSNVTDLMSCAAQLIYGSSLQIIKEEKLYCMMKTSKQVCHAPEEDSLASSSKTRLSLSNQTA